jgi:hypothetical protein
VLADGLDNPKTHRLDAASSRFCEVAGGRRLTTDRTIIGINWGRQKRRRPSKHATTTTLRRPKYPTVASDSVRPMTTPLAVACAKAMKRGPRACIKYSSRITVAAHQQRPT